MMNQKTKSPSPVILLTIMFGPFLSMLDSGIINVGLPSMASEFRTTLGGIQWVASVYLMTISALLPLLGSLADQVGRKKIFNLGFLVLAVFSLLSTWAPNLPMLVLFRVLQGVGGAMIIANGMALATEHYPASQRGRNLGLLATMGALGSILGPALGGLLIGFWGWRSVFTLSFIVATAGWLASARTIPHDSKIRHKSFRLDWWGALLLALTIVAFALGLSLLNGGARAVLWWASELVAALAFSGFLLWERRVAHPILRLELFGNPTFSSSWILSLVAFLALYTPTVLVPFYFQTVLGFAPGLSGLAMMAFPVALAVVSPVSGRLSDRWGSVRLATAGLALGSLGFFGMAFVGPASPSWFAIVGLAVLGASLGLFQSPNNSTLLGSAPRALLGSATGFTQVARNIGMAAGISLSGTIFAILHGPTSTLEPLAFFTSARIIYVGSGALLLAATVFSLARTKKVPRPIG